MRNIPDDVNLSDRLELLFAQNRIPFRCEVQSMPLGWVVLVSGLVPEQFQGAIREYLCRAMGMECRQINMVWRNGSTTIELVMR